MEHLVDRRCDFPAIEVELLSMKSLDRGLGVYHPGGITALLERRISETRRQPRADSEC